MIKSALVVALLALTTSVSASISGPCSGHAKSAAIRAYKAQMGTVQGSDGIEYEIKEKLKAKLPFHNYVVTIFDNNEDGDTWSVDYFVMTKLEGQTCKVLKVKEERPALIKFQGLENSDVAQTIEVDVNYVNNSENYIDFRAFIDEDTYSSYCYTGDQESVKDIINSILDVSTGDSFILSSKLSTSQGKIIHQGTYTAGSGDHDFALDFELSECK